MQHGKSLFREGGRHNIPHGEAADLSQRFGQRVQKFGDEAIDVLRLVPLLAHGAKVDEEFDGA